MIKKILFPTDFSDDANNALKMALLIARRNNASIMIHHTCNEESLLEEYQNSGLAKFVFPNQCLIYKIYSSSWSWSTLFYLRKIAYSNP